MPRAHLPEFRRRAIELARAGGRARSELARDLGISASCPRNRVAQADKDEGVTEGLTSTERVSSPSCGSAAGCSGSRPLGTTSGADVHLRREHAPMPN